MSSPIGVLYHQRAKSAWLSAPVDEVDLRGFVNLIGLVFVTTNCREIVDNCLRYGWVVRWFSGERFDFAAHVPLAIGTSSIVVLALVGYLVEARRGDAFAKTWAHAIAEMQALELELQAAKSTFNIYKLKPATSPQTTGGLSPARPPALSDASDVVTPTSRADDEEAEEDEGEEEEDDDDAARVDSASEPAEQEQREELKAVALNRFRSSRKSFRSRRVSAEITATQRYKHAAQRYIDATKNIDLAKILSAAEGYVRQQQEKIKVIKEEINEMMSPLVRVYNNLSMRITESHVEFAHMLKTGTVSVLMLGIPYMTILSSTFNPKSSLFILMLSCTWLLKMISFFHTLHSLRKVIVSDTTSLRSIIPFDDERASYLHYPNSLSFGHFVNYLFAPTLCFQFNYPRSARRNWGQIAKTFVQLLFSLVLLKIIFEQYLTKILENTFIPYSEGIRGDWLSFGAHLVERLLKLSMPTLYCWLLMFLSFFHYWMTLLAQLTRFEDQEFYKDWWNATCFAEYWRKWNLPVHQFCRRHLYLPLLLTGCSKYFAGQCVFLLSAVAHEYIIAGSLKLGWTGLVFLSFVMQTPLGYLTELRWVKARPIMGNCMFWIAFSFSGHPMGVLIFYYLWNIKAGTMAPIQAEQLRQMPIYKSEL